MKKTIALLLTMLMIAACACAEQEEEELFASLYGIEWSFSSGVGAWSTEMRILPDGAFSGEFHDADLGDTGPAYPDGTLYLCSFTGQLRLGEQIDGQTWKLRVEQLTADESPAESIEGGTRYVTTEPYGISEGDEMILYAPGTPLETLPEDMVFWTHAQFLDPQPDALEGWFLCSVKNESGFVGLPPDETAYMPNPWLDLTEEELKASAGVSFCVPEGARDVLYRYLPGEDLAEMQFFLDDDEYCARTQPAVLQDGQLMEISGMYFAWENEETVEVDGCAGTLGTAQTGSEEWVERCLWYDAAAERMYSLSVYTTDPDGLELAAVAEQISE